MNLTRQERAALIFLTATFLLGLVVSFHKTRIRQPRIEIVSTAEKKVPVLTTVNINSATRQELIRLKGIGPSLAEAVIDYREKNGRFLFKSDIMKVRGIGKAKFESIKDSISVR